MGGEAADEGLPVSGGGEAGKGGEEEEAGAEEGEIGVDGEEEGGGAWGSDGGCGDAYGVELVGLGLGFDG